MVTSGANLESTMAAVAVHMILPKVKHVNLTFKKAIKKIRGKTFEDLSQDAYSHTLKNNVRERDAQRALDCLTDLKSW